MAIELDRSWRGIIVSESLKDPSEINQLEIYKAEISTRDLDLGDGKRGRWHIYYVLASESQIDSLSMQLKGGWYCHFWNSDALKIVFPSKKFDASVSDRMTWKDAITYGSSIGIPEDELDFPTE